MSDQPGDKKRSGQVRHDAGGRAIWEWAVESGRHAIDSTSRLLKRLDLSGLTLLDDETKHWEKDAPEAPEAMEAAAPRQSQRQPSTPVPPMESARGTGPATQPGSRSFNPYDTRAPSRRAATPGKPSAPPRPRITQPVRPTKKPGLIARLLGRSN